MGLLVISWCSGTAATAVALATAAVVVALVALISIVLVPELGGTPDATATVDGLGVAFG